MVDAHTVVLINKDIDPDLLFLLGQATAIIVEPRSAATNASKPVGTGPYQLSAWSRGASIALTAWPGWRQAAQLKVRRATFRFIPDPAAQVAALLAGDVDAFARVTPRSMAQFKGDPRFQVIVSGSRAKTILAINNAKKPLDDVRVRRAIAAAIDRKAVIQGAADGLGVPIGSHYVPGAFGYVDTTGINPYDPEKARKLLADSGGADRIVDTLVGRSRPEMLPWTMGLVGAIIGTVMIFGAVGTAVLANPQAFENEDPAAVLAMLGSMMGGIAVMGLVGLAFLLWVGIVDSQKGDNKYGPNPKGE